MIEAVVRWVLPGALAGWLGATLAGDRFARPDLPDPNVWNLVSPALDEALADPDLGRGTHLLGGALTIRQHAFFRADILSPRAPGDVARVELGLAPDSGPVRLLWQASGTPVFLNFTADAWMTHGGAWRPREVPGPWIVTVEDGDVRVGDEVVGAGQPGRVELTSPAGEARIRTVRMLDAQGGVLVDEDYSGRRAGPGVVVLGSVLGALAGMALRLATRRAISPREGALRAALLVIPPLLVALVPSGAWLRWVERLYLVRLPAWELARVALAVSLLPLAVAALLATGSLVPTGRGPRHGLAAWVAVALVASSVAARGAPLPALLGAAFLLLPLHLARRSGVDPGAALLRDLPAALAVATLGWGTGLGVAVAWRLLGLVASARTLLRAAPGPAADHLFLLLVLVLPAAELAARATWLDTAWDAARLAGERESDRDWRDPVPWWEASCGEGARAGVAFAGGSSTGAAYQFHDEPEAFFAAQVHQRLCAGGAAVRTTNFGDGGRDTFTISRTIGTLLDRADAKVLVLYVGVNDVLTANSSLTRKQMEAALAERTAAEAGLAGFAMRSRVVTGLGLLVRPPPGVGGLDVPAVPLPDAEENLRAVVAVAAGRGVDVVLVPEHVMGEMRAQMVPYTKMLARLAAQLDGVTFVDLPTALAEEDEAALMVDRNHLSRLGGQRVADVLAPVVAGLLAR